MFVVALTVGLVFGVIAGGLLVARFRLKLNFALIGLVVLVLILVSLPVPRELTVGLSAGLLLGVVLVQIREPASGSGPPVDL